MNGAATTRRTILRRGAIGVLAWLALWEVGAQLGEWIGVAVPILDKVPPPHAVLGDLAELVQEGGYWNSWALSLQRVLWGFAFALAVGVPVALLIVTSRVFRGLVFPVFETLRPIPPLAWVPLAIIFWPTQELSITFVTFLGAFFPIVLNIVDGAAQIDRRLVLISRSLGLGRLGTFARVLLPSTLPAMVTGAAIGMGITWEVVVAAELISGGGNTSGDGGLGFLVWNAYQGNDLPRIVVGMISLGVAGYLSSTLVRALGARLMPWRRAA
jgi:NitT/TauT family transport system permease protein